MKLVIYCICSVIGFNKGRFRSLGRHGVGVRVGRVGIRHGWLGCLLGLGSGLGLFLLLGFVGIDYWTILERGNSIISVEESLHSPSSE